MPEPGSTAAQEYKNVHRYVKKALKKIIIPVVPKARVYSRFVWSPNDNTWAGLLKSENDTIDDEKQVNAVQFYFTGAEEAQGEETPIGSMDPVIPVGIDFFVKYDRGKEEDNSELRLFDQMALVKMTLAENQQLDVLMDEDPSIDMTKYIMGITGLRVPIVTMRQFGDHALQYGLGTFNVRLQSWYVGGPD